MDASQLANTRGTGRCRIGMTDAMWVHHPRMVAGVWKIFMRHAADGNKDVIARAGATKDADVSAGKSVEDISKKAVHVHGSRTGRAGRLRGCRSEEGELFSWGYGYGQSPVWDAGGVRGVGSDGRVV